MYLNFAETHSAAPFWTEQAYRRLCRIKAAVDPADLICANHPIPPAGRPIDPEVTHVGYRSRTA
jgi:hypothetical protein